MSDFKMNEVMSFAFKKHHGQCRPNKNQEPKSIHLTQVAQLVKKSGGSKLAIAAGYLHDTVEDTDTTIEEIFENFGIGVAKLVAELTDPLDFLEMELTQRKQKQSERIKFADQNTKLVKVADQLSNIISVYNDPPTEWDNKKCLEYIIGAKKIVDACSGVNSYLEAEFNKIYDLSITLYT
jgi:(p)ppGpp synthase/HD superfamily hydrolase